MYANKSLARNLLIVFIEVGGIWDSKISGGGWLEGTQKRVIIINLFNFLEKIFWKIF